MQDYFEHHAHHVRWKFHGINLAVSTFRHQGWQQRDQLQFPLYTGGDIAAVPPGPTVTDLARLVRPYAMFKAISWRFDDIWFRAGNDLRACISRLLASSPVALGLRL